MKLKITDKGTYKVLSISEGVSPKEAEVLNVGLRRMIQMENKALVLDLTAAAPGALGTEIEGFRMAASSMGLTLVVVCPESGHGDVATLSEAEAKLKIPLPLEEQESQLSARYNQLQKIRDDIRAKLETVKKSGDDLVSIKREGSDHQWRVREFERVGQELAKELRTREESKELKEKEEKIRGKLREIFGGELIDGTSGAPTRTAPKAST